jgi:hypothetical protein
MEINDLDVLEFIKILLALIVLFIIILIILDVHICIDCNCFPEVKQEVLRLVD